MRRFPVFLLAVFFAAVSFPSLALAAEKTGVYVAPKFVYGHAVMDKLKGNYSAWDTVDGSEDRPWASASKRDSDDVFGGALAVGYDFYPRFELPIRAELEYSLFSQAEGNASRTNTSDLPGGYWGKYTYDYKQKLDIQTLFLNAYFDIKTGTPITPYLGAGLGFAFIKAKGGTDFFMETNLPGAYMPGAGKTDAGSKNVTNFAWNVGAGLGWAMTDSLTLDLGYRFVGLGEVKSKTATKDFDRGPEYGHYNRKTKIQDLYMHQVLLSLRYTF